MNMKNKEKYMKKSWFLCWDKLTQKYVKVAVKDLDFNDRYDKIEKYTDEKALNDAIEFFNVKYKENHNNKLEINKEEDKKVTNHPLRYGGDTVYETIKVLKNWVSKEEYRGFLLCNAIKYLSRLGKKDDEIQECDKVIWYVNKLKESYQEEKSK